MKANIVFGDELAKIKNEQLADAVAMYFEECVPDYFWTVPSSMSGKYHSRRDAGEGGLVVHTKICVAVAEELLRLDEYSGLDSDILIAAMLLHDSQKNGSNGRHYRADHPRLAADAWAAYAKKIGLPNSVYEPIIYCIAWHSGQWSGPSTRNNFEKPEEYKLAIKCAHLSDYIASRPFIG